MNAKLILLGVGAAFVTSVAVPASLAKAKKETNDEDVTPRNGILPENKEWEETLGDEGKSFRKRLSGTDRIIFDQFHKVGHKHQNKKHKEIYPNYFLDSSGNQETWNSKFDYIKTNYQLENDTIVYRFGQGSSEPDARISKGWSENSSEAYDSSNLSLNSFCKHKIDSLSREAFWILCSSFLERPQTVLEDQKDTSLNSPKQIGNTLELFLISPTDNDSFWNKRQSEWAKLSPNNSTYFKYDSSKQIKDLCKDAYYKEIDAPAGPSQEEVLKYCSLEWDS